MPDPEQQHETALRAANLALSGRRQSETRSLTVVDLRLDDPRTGAWEMAAMAAVALASTLAAVGLWFW